MFFQKIQQTWTTQAPIRVAFLICSAVCQTQNYRKKRCSGSGRRNVWLHGPVQGVIPGTRKKIGTSPLRPRTRCLRVDLLTCVYGVWWKNEKRKLDTFLAPLLTFFCGFQVPKSLFFFSREEHSPRSVWPDNGKSKQTVCVVRGKVLHRRASLPTKKS